MYRYTELYKRALLSNGVGIGAIGKKHLEPSPPIKIMLASGSRLFLEGVRKILEDEGSIKIVTEASSWGEATKRVNELEFDFLFIDSSTLSLDTNDISDLINKKGSNTKVILLENQAKDRIDIPDVIHITKETGSSELIYIIKLIEQPHYIHRD
ncbi:MAG: hypothetical protein C4291_12550 [Candidatus Dadabacteria bacterium]